MTIRILFNIKAGSFLLPLHTAFRQVQDLMARLYNILKKQVYGR